MDSTIIDTTTISNSAFEIRKANFTDEISFFAPGLKHYAIDGFEQKNPNSFLPISLTGNACGLDCDHCDTKILDPMIPLHKEFGLFEMAKKMKASGTESLLISGGSNKKGQVPFLKHIDDIKKIKEVLGMKIIMHTGLVDEAMVLGLKEAGVDGVALDIIGTQETITEVYHMDATPSDFDNTLDLLTKHGLSIRPHIILGLHYGKFLGEYKALEMIKKYPTHALIIVVLTPLHDTPMFGIDPPDTDKVEEFMIHARKEMPDTKILLGCARPGGDYKKIVDFAAVRAGINGIAYPASGVIDYAAKLGLKPLLYENACSCGVE